jgi:hypothetical protein
VGVREIDTFVNQSLHLLSYSITAFSISFSGICLSKTKSLATLLYTIFGSITIALVVLTLFVASRDIYNIFAVKMVVSLIKKISAIVPEDGRSHKRSNRPNLSEVSHPSRRSSVLGDNNNQSARGMSQMPGYSDAS